MGSKRKLASTIVDFILLENPQCKYVYDLFGGGGAITYEFAKRGQISQVIYNDLNTGVVNLHIHLSKNSLTKEDYRWVSREEFNQLKNGTDYYSGIVKTCWSFGNNPEKGYMYGSNIEELKKQAHDYLIDNGYFENKHLRKALIKEFKSENRIFSRLDLQRLEQLERLQHLERLEQLEQLHNNNFISFLNLEYNKVIIDTPIEETVIYLDPPYFGTGKYQCAVNHETLKEYCINSKYKIYLSSYEFDGLNPVLSINHRSILSATNNSNKVIEKLFTNQ